MLLKRFGLSSYRKFGKKMQYIDFNQTNAGVTNSGNDKKILTTLLMGQNNTGKTSILTALKTFIEEKSFSVEDFNIDVLKETLEDNANSFLEGKTDPFLTPSIEAEFTISVDEKNDELQNLTDLITSDIANGEIVFKAVYSCTEKALYNEEIKNLFEKLKITKENVNDVIGCYFGEYTHLLSTLLKKGFRIIFLKPNDEEVSDFKISNLFSLHLVSIDQSAPKLSTKFCGFLKKYLESDDNLYNLAQDVVDNTKGILNNKQFTDGVCSKVKKSIVVAFNKDKVDFQLTPNMTVDDLFENTFSFIFLEEGKQIPETQFGAGYHSLLAITEEILDYFSDFAEESSKAKVHIIEIEEPEVHMHPQMERTFIQKIDAMVKELLPTKFDGASIQILISTHSSSVVKGKLDRDGSFDNINYLTVVKGENSIISFTDKEAFGAEEERTFLLKYFKSSMVDCFFADNVILVEGTAEEILLPVFEELYDEKAFVSTSIIPLGGAFAHKYIPFFRHLGIPTAIITDLDIQQDDQDGKGGNDDEVSVSDLSDKKTTNQTIVYWNREIQNYEKPEMILNRDGVFEPFHQDGNICISTQSGENRFFPSSLEEAIILSNPKNTSVKKAIKTEFPVLYNRKAKESKGDNEINDLTDYAKYFQNKLSSSKSDFAMELAKNISEEFATRKGDSAVTNESPDDSQITTNSTDSEFLIPKYIIKAFDFITQWRKNEQQR